MKVGWCIPTIETFGSVREMIEVSNVFVELGHEVTIFHPQGHKCVWLPCSAKFKKLDTLHKEQLDVLIGIVDWQPELYDLMVGHNAKIKAVCLMGFNPHDTKLASILNGKRKPRDKADRILRDSIERGHVLLGDGGWQMDWVRERVPAAITGPAFGGINLEMFSTAQRKNTRGPWRILHSGDGRERKGGDTVEEALTYLRIDGALLYETSTYWGTIDQGELVGKLCKGDIFLDGHRRAGWCNPVIEAMACGNAIVCTDIGAVRDFAINEKTALVVPTSDPLAMAQAAVRLMKDTELLERLVGNGLKKVAEYDYKVVAPKLATYFQAQL